MGKDNVTLTVIKRELLQDKVALISVVFLVSLILILTASVFLVDENAVFQMRANERFLRLNLRPSREFWLGTNGWGQDVLLVLLVATRNSLTITIIATLISSAFGTLYGLVSGYIGGRVDNFMNGIVDMITAVPNLIALIILLNFFGGFNERNFILTVSLLAWTGVAKVIRARVVQEKNLEYIMASKTLGTSHFKIIFQKLIPNLSTPIIAGITLNAGAIIIMESVLAFFLVDATPGSIPVYFSGGITLGRVLALTGYTTILRFRPWQWVPAVTMVVLIMFSINSIGNILNKVADEGRR